MDFKALAAGIIALIAIGLIVGNGKSSAQVGNVIFSGVNNSIAELERLTPKGETNVNAG